MPAAPGILSMSADSHSNLYMVDTYSRRLIVLLWDSPQCWYPAKDECIPPAQPETLPTSHPLAAALGAASACVLVMAGATGCFYVRWRRRRSVNLCVQVEEIPFVALTEEPNWVTGDKERQASRFDYYVAQYEIVAAVASLPPTQAACSLPSPSSRSTASTKSSCSTSSQHADEYFSSPDLPVSAASVVLPRINQLNSVLTSASSFIDSVNNLSILSEGSAGLACTTEDRLSW